MTNLKLSLVPKTFHFHCAASNQPGVLPSLGTAVASATYPAPYYVPDRYLEISTDADYSYYKFYKEDTFAQIQAILNAAEAIYTAQLGIRFDLKSQNMFSSSTQPYTSKSPTTLLDQFRTYSESHHQLASADVYHLFTGKDLDGGTIGLSYVGPACRDKSFAYGLTQRVSSSIQALVTAHEIGHSLGATHPEDTLDNPANSLMTGIVEPANTSFSDFSLGQIISQVDTYDSDKSCLSETASNTLLLALTLQRGSKPGDRSRFGAFLSSSFDHGSCSAYLYSSTRREKLSDASIINGKATLLKESDFNSSDIKYIARFSAGRASKTQNLYFKSQIICSNLTQVDSPIRRLRLHAYITSQSVKRAISLIKRTIQIN